MVFSTFADDTMRAARALFEKNVDWVRKFRDHYVELELPKHMEFDEIREPVEHIKHNLQWCYIAIPGRAGTIELIATDKYITITFIDESHTCRGVRISFAGPQTEVYLGELSVVWSPDSPIYHWMPNGRGKVRHGGQSYDGEWLFGKKHGRGQMVWPNGQSYDGEWACGQMHGRGSMMCVDGQLYEGKWENEILVEGTINGEPVVFLCV